MICLGFTSSTEQGSIALFYKNKAVQLASWTRKEQASDAITSKIKSGLSKKKISLNDLTLIAVDKGPGSFTGNRISVNIAKTLAYTLNIPIITLSSLDILAFGISKNLKTKNSFHIFTLLDAHRSLFYFRDFKKNVGEPMLPGQPIQALSLEEVRSRIPSSGHLILLGNLSKKTLSLLKEEIEARQPQVTVSVPTKTSAHFPQASCLVEMASLLPKSAHSSWDQVEPSYIRSPDAVEKYNLEPKPEQLRRR